MYVTFVNNPCFHSPKSYRSSQREGKSYTYRSHFWELVSHTIFGLWSKTLVTISCLALCHPKCGRWTSSTGVTWELVKDADTQVPARPPEWATYILTGFPTDSHTWQSVRSTDRGQTITDGKKQYLPSVHSASVRSFQNLSVQDYKTLAEALLVFSRVKQSFLRSGNNQRSRKKCWGAVAGWPPPARVSTQQSH